MAVTLVTANGSFVELLIAVILATVGGLVIPYIEPVSSVTVNAIPPTVSDIEKSVEFII